jgi:hypothetical protein
MPFSGLISKPSPFRFVATSPEIIRVAVMLYVRFPLSLRKVEDLLHERGVDVGHATVRYWWHRFAPMLAAEIRSRLSAARARSGCPAHRAERQGVATSLLLVPRRATAAARSIGGRSPMICAAVW